ncbi:MAG: hypothetical protein ACE5E2_04615 [Candidatus Binatia bacterium]
MKDEIKRFIVLVAFIAVVLGATAFAQEYTVALEDVQGNEPDYSNQRADR